MGELLTIVAQALASVAALRDRSHGSNGIQISLDEKKRFEIAKEVAEQIWREQQITNYRMIWLLTFQGFLLTSSGLTFTGLSTVGYLPSVLTRLVLALAGIATTIATWQSVRASQLQRDELKHIWRRVYQETHVCDFPRPFSIDHSKRGRHAGLWIVRTIVLMWVAMALMTIYFASTDQVRDSRHTDRPISINL